MNEKIRIILQQIHTLEKELRHVLHEQEERVFYKIEGTRIKFERKVKKKHLRLKVGLIHWFRNSRPLNVLSAPFVYSMIFPIFLLDTFITIYQAICFRLYKMPRVPRSEYIVIDRHHLAYLNLIEKLNCVFCGYANGVIAYAREIAARTEQYWCPIKHSCKVLGSHKQCRCFLPYGQATDYHAQLTRFRDELCKKKKP